MKSATPSMLEQVPVYSYFMTGRNQLDCFDKIVIPSMHCTKNKANVSKKKIVCLYSSL